jgi:hypothetical protein
MNDDHEKMIQYGPLNNLLEALDSDDKQDRDELEASLEARGFDPARVTESIRETVATGVRAQRLAWQGEAEAKRKKLQRLREKAQSWALRSVQDVETAFEQVVQGAFGSVAQQKVQAAFRNLDQVSPDDKASFLDDIALIDAMGSEDEESKPS